MAEGSVESLKALGIPIEDEAAPTAAAPDVESLRALGIPIQDEAAPPQTTEGDLQGSALRGLKTALAPHLLTKEDIKGDRTKGEIATEMGTAAAADIGTSLLGAAAAGAVGGAVAGPPGAAAGAVIAPIALALYRGFGYEKARSTAEGQSFNPIRGALNSAAEINPLVSKGGRLLKFATQGALEATREMSYSGDKDGALLSGALGAVFGGAFHKAGPGWFAALGDQAVRPNSNTVAPGLLKKEADNLAEAVADTSATGLGAKLEAGAARAAEADPNYFKLGSKIEAGGEEMDEFKKWYMTRPGMRHDDGELEAAWEQATRGLRSADDDVRKAATQRVEDGYKWFKLQKVANEVVADHNKQLAAGVSGAKDPLGGALDKVRDIKFVMRKVDRQLGTNFDGAIDMFTEAKNKQSVAMTGYLTQANKLVKAGRKADLDNVTVGKWLAEDPSVQLSGDQLKVAEGWRDLFEQARQHLRKEGLEIDFLGQSKQGRYLPLSAKRGPDMARSLRRELVQHGDNLDSADAADLRKMVGSILDIEPSQVVTKQQVESAIDAALNPKHSAKMGKGYEASATFKREGLLPANFRDYDVGSLFTNYLNTNFKAVHYHDAFTQLSAQMDMLKSLGFNETHRYLDKYMAHVSGSKSDKLAGLQYNINKYKSYMDRVFDEAGGEGLKANAARAAGKLPDMAAFAVGQIYPNYLGFNPRAALRNYAQPLLLTAPELGGRYGSALVAKASLRAAEDFFKRRVNMEEVLKAKGLAPGKFFGEGMNAADDSFRTVKGVGAAVEGLEAVNNAGMAFYSKSDIVNRYITTHVADQLAKDALAGNRRALDFMKDKLSQGGKASVRKLLAEGNVEELSNELAKYLVGKTQFNYGKESMNEFGREWGRLASMFTKWPAMVMSDSADLIDDQVLKAQQRGSSTAAGVGHGLGLIARRYGAPLAALAAAGAALNNVTNDSPTVKYLLGSDLSSAAPAQSFKVTTPPVFSSAASVVGAIGEAFKADKTADEKLRKAGKAALGLAKTYLPGTGPLNEFMRVRRAYYGDED